MSRPDTRFLVQRIVQASGFRIHIDGICEYHWGSIVICSDELPPRIVAYWPGSVVCRNLLRIPASAEVAAHPDWQDWWPDADDAPLAMHGTTEETLRALLASISFRFH